MWKLSLSVVAVSTLLLSGMTQAALFDVTTPGDTVKGVPDDGDWPGGEHPALAIDDSSGTKYLHFKGEIQPTGFAVTPSARQTIVTGLTFTTANDAPERDPVAFELYGSNVSIDGPYTLIASGDIVDFSQPAAWPRFTMNQTEISFANEVAYDHYQVLITAVRDPTAANSMQIAEVELLGVCLLAFNPTPRNGAKGVPIDAILTWSPGAGAVSHDGYFGTSSPPPFLGNTTETSFDLAIIGGLEYGTTYYWRLDAVEADGTKHTGDIWSFTTTVPVGLFEFTKDIGGPAGIGSTVLTDTDEYLITGGGGDIWGHADQFHYAYNIVEGDIRVSANFDWVCSDNDWAKIGVMLRESEGGPSAHYMMCERGEADYAGMQGRPATGASSSEFGTRWDTGCIAVAIQKVTVEGLTWIEGLADFGEGWVSRGIVLDFALPDKIMAGVCLTSHDNDHLAQARVWNVAYEPNPSLVGTLEFPLVPAEAAMVFDPTGKTSGFKIRTLKALFTDGWGRDEMTKLLDFGCTGPMCTAPGMPIPGAEEGERISQFVNLHDTAGRGVFDNDESFPGIDPFESPTQDPAAGDDDNNFATEVTGVIQLTAGLHIIAVNDDDGTIIEIGGVEIGRSSEWKGTSTTDFIFKVAADGFYPFRARHLEGGGGAALEIHEVLMDGTRILLNDVAAGGSAVYAP